GWVHLPGFFGPSEMASLVAWTDEVTGWPETPGAWMRYYEKAPDGGRMLARIENFVPYHEELATLLTTGRVRELMAECCDAPVVLHDLPPRRRGGPSRRLLRAQARVLPARIRAPTRRRLRAPRRAVQPGKPVRLTGRDRLQKRAHADHPLEARRGSARAPAVGLARLRTARPARARRRHR